MGHRRTGPPCNMWATSINGLPSFNQYEIQSNAIKYYLVIWINSDGYALYIITVLLILNPFRFFLLLSSFSYYLSDTWRALCPGMPDIRASNIRCLTEQLHLCWSLTLWTFKQCMHSRHILYKWFGHGYL